MLYNAVSLDGFIATLDGDSGWAVDDEEFEAHVKEIGCILIGRKTFEQYEDEIYPVISAINFVYSHTPEHYKGSEQVHFVGGSPVEVLDQIKQKGFKKILLGGGAETNSAFAEAGLINEMILDVHPTVLGSGLPLLGDYTKRLNLELVSSQQNPKGYVQIRYLVKGKD